MTVPYIVLYLMAAVCLIVALLLAVLILPAAIDLWMEMRRRWFR